MGSVKGGNASITEPACTLENKLKPYQRVIAEIEGKFNGRALSELDEKASAELVVLCQHFIGLTGSQATRIRGFGPSYASALLSAHFLDLVPVLDRRILNGAGISAEYNRQGQVKDISRYYGKLIAACRAELIRRKSLTLRELDREWFTKAL